MRQQHVFDSEVNGLAFRVIRQNVTQDDAVIDVPEHLLEHVISRLGSLSAQYLTMLAQTTGIDADVMLDRTEVGYLERWLGT